MVGSKAATSAGGQQATLAVTDEEAYEAFSRVFPEFDALRSFYEKMGTLEHYFRKATRQYKKDPQKFSFEKFSCDCGCDFEEIEIEYRSLKAAVSEARWLTGRAPVVGKLEILDQAHKDLTWFLKEEARVIRQKCPDFPGLPTEDEILKEVYEWLARVTSLPADELLEALIGRVGRIWGPTLLWEWWAKFHLIDTAELRHLILSVWSMGDSPEDLGTEQWLEMFEAAGFVSDGPTKPETPITVFRGAPDGMQNRMAWTTDLEIAVDFGGPDGNVWTTTVPPEAVLARIENVRPGESEILVNPQYLIGSATPSIVPTDKCDFEVRSEERDEASPDPLIEKFAMPREAAA